MKTNMIFGVGTLAMLVSMPVFGGVQGQSEALAQAVKADEAAAKSSDQHAQSAQTDFGSEAFAQRLAEIIEKEGAEKLARVIEQEVQENARNKISVEQRDLQEERLDTSQAKRPFTEPKLTFVEPKLTEYGDATKITANGSFGHFS